MASAVMTRETAIVSAWTTFTASIGEALTDRASALEAAWNGSKEGNRAATKSAWGDWKEAKKAAHSKLRNDRKTAWDAFKKTAKESCKMTTPKEEGLEKSTSDSIAL
jgi:hypothetical protein